MASNLLKFNCKPTLGYHSQSAAVIALREEKGLTWGQIGLKLGVSGSTASAKYSRAKQRAERASRVIEVDASMFLGLEREAVRRETTPHELAKSLLTVICADDLYNAVLG